MILNKEKVMESIKATNCGSTGCNMKMEVAAYNLLEYICSNDNYDEIIDLIYKFYNEEYDYEASLTIPTDEIGYMLSICCTLLLSENKISFDDVGLKAKKYTDKDITKFFKFANLINKKYDFELTLNSINTLQLQRNLLSQENLEKTIKNAEDKMDDINIRIDKIHFDTISIISIFVAVIFALYGGTQLVSSIITRISSDNYKLMFKTALILGYILFTFISTLLSVMTWHDKRANKKWLLIILNAIFAIVVVLSWIFLK